ncbi:rhamnulokinase [Lacrimispora xylanolytica]|uniref:Rhamnulokinase n=1 Tax=Lacrimispora xylanolytica TaxID=29375 RepID=A0ABY7AEG0_9FIRM|nr:rhamnulokinase [Lacrimispora xylanolytica]MBS5957044.1 rhamnulokinase [Clostridiales bacterium]WAJ24991.1 rhamnulokinase [Lacrimispora xylanolytica]
MEKYYLAVDIGASSGRHILGTVKDGNMVLEEIYRFENGMKRMGERLCWDVESLFAEIKEGMKACKKLGKIPVSMGIDTWAVDFVLLDREGKLLSEAVGYRDDRTKGMDEEVYKTIPLLSLYERTGIQKQIFNTIYQLMAVKKQTPEHLKEAETFLMIPDYFHYLLTGVKKQEYTNATTTQLVSPETGTWDYDLIQSLGLPEGLFLPLSMPGTLAGGLAPQIIEEVGFDCQVVLPATHDTASAVMAVPVVPGGSMEDLLYISSGTWSLMGTELLKADCSVKSMEANFTNEGGYDYRYRYLKNIMGLWMIQSVRKELSRQGEEYSFAQLCDMASRESISSLVDCNDSVFLAPESMIQAVREYCRNHNQQEPKTPGEISAVIYNSLAVCYEKTIKELESITGKTYPAIHVVGGGSQAEYLNQLTADMTGRTVYAGPGEATAIGNLLAQMLSFHEFDDLKQAREGVYRSFAVKEYRPQKGKK